MDFEQILYDKSDGIATITLNRPERMNAFTGQMLAEWALALTDARDDDDVRAVVVTGAGRGFCTGMDVRETQAGQGLWDPQASLAQRRHFLRDTVHRVPRTLATLDKPYIGAINGPAVGAGMDMASMCDIRIAADTARFSMAYVRMGLIPGDGGCYFLPRIVGLAKALELIWTGEIIDAQEALRIGYVSEVVPADQLMDHSRQFAMRLAKGPAAAIQLGKRLVYRSLETNMSHALELAESAMLVCQTTEDAREGPRAWAEKREPQFKGR